MLKDGTRYLCVIEYPTGRCDWEVIHWGAVSFLSSLSAKDTWVDSTGMAPRIKQIVEFKKLRKL